MAFDQAPSLAGKTKAVIVDPDETLLDNSAYSAWQAKSNQPFSKKSWSAWTQARFDAIKNAGYNVVLYVGDNLNDFGAATWHQGNAQRRELVSLNHQRFGTQYIILPNPLYADWESGMADNYNQLTPQQKVDTRKSPSERLER